MANPLAAAEVWVLLAERGDRAVGLACVAPGWLQGLFVVPDAWAAAWLAASMRRPS